MPAGYRILVAGPAKSGTTAAFFALKAAMPADTVCLFEPRDRSLPSLTAGPVLAKLLFGPNRPLSDEVVAAFDRTVLLVRDPRDRLISRLLYDIYNEPEIWSHAERVETFVNLLHRKEADPAGVAIVEIIDAFDRMARRAMLPRVTENPTIALAFQRRHAGAVLLRYDDLVRRHFDAIAGPLGFALGATPIVVPDEFRRVARSQTSGDWRHWLTPRDVAYFTPHFQPYLEANGFDPGWTLAQTPRIDPEVSSRYVLRLVAERLTLAPAAKET